MAREASSLEKSIREALGTGAVLGFAHEPEQLDLLRNEDTGLLPANVYQLMRKPTGGRPEGARNRRNVKLAKLITQQSGDPVLYMASLYAMPLDQLVELLRIADNSAGREARLIECVQDTLACIHEAENRPSDFSLELVAKALGRVADAAEDAAKSKPGDLAIKALAVQLQAARATAEYTHGKMPVTVDLRDKTDAVIFAPELLKQYGIDPAQLEAELEKRGLDAFDIDEVKLIPNLVEAEGDDADGE